MKLTLLSEVMCGFIGTESLVPHVTVQPGNLKGTIGNVSVAQSGMSNVKVKWATF